MPVSLSIVLPYWLDRPNLEAVEIATSADAAGFGALWVGEMMTFDAFALASVIARETTAIRLVVGPLAVGVRTPASLALGMASVRTLGARGADLALGASNPLVIGAWHGRSFAHPVARMRETIAALRPMLAGERSSCTGTYESSTGFRTAGDPSHATISVAAFGEKMLGLASAVADRIVVNLVTSRQVARTKAAIAHSARAAGRDAPPLAVWLPVAIEPGPAAWQQLARQLVVYAGAPGYGEMFAEAGFASTVSLARSGAHPREILAAMPRELMKSIGAVGSAAEVRRRLDEYREAGADEIGIVPVTADDPAGARLMDELRPR